jgi:hypothetical protein
MALFAEWCKEKRNHLWFHEYPSKPFVRVAALCEFGGSTYKSPFGFSDSEEAGGTWAVCPCCNNIFSCGYHDTTGLNPKRCRECGAKLSQGDYFQPVYYKHYICRTKGYCDYHRCVHDPATLKLMRKAILAVLEGCGKPLNPTELIEAIKKEAPELWQIVGNGYAEKAIKEKVLGMIASRALLFSDDRKIAIFRK